MASSSLQMVLRVQPVLAPAGRMDRLQRVAHHVPADQEAPRLVAPGRRARLQRPVQQVPVALVALVLAVPVAHAPVVHQAVLAVGL